MDLWIWILLAVAIVVLFVAIAATLRAIRPKAPEPLGAMVPTPSSANADPAASSRRGPHPAPGPLPPAVIAQIDALVAAEQKIMAIKLLREHSGLSLRGAKDQIDAWVPSASGAATTPAVSFERSGARPAGAPPYAGGLPVALAHLSPEVRAEIGRLVTADQKIAAIKLLRESTGLGLKDSKDAIESWR